MTPFSHIYLQWPPWDVYTSILYPYSDPLWPHISAVTSLRCRHLITLHTCTDPLWPHISAVTSLRCRHLITLHTCTDPLWPHISAVTSLRCRHLITLHTCSDPLWLHIYAVTQWTQMPAVTPPNTHLQWLPCDDECTVILASERVQLQVCVTTVGDATEGVDRLCAWHKLWALCYTRGCLQLVTRQHPDLWHTEMTTLNRNAIPANTQI